MGYHRAGFEVVGVDHKPQPRYPFEFILGDALTVDLSGFNAYAASPPCQRYSIATGCNGRARRDAHPDLVTPTRARLAATGKPYIIENVPGAPLLHPVKLDGEMFGLPLIRMRWFESNVYLMTPRPIRRRLGMNYVCPAGGSYRNRGFNKASLQRAMGIDWLTGAEMCQAIPPAYTEFLGRQLIEQLRPSITAAAA